ncbi:MAG: hypothetical protein R3A44_18045 [Caldilineaceae bacterium]
MCASARELGIAPSSLYVAANDTTQAKAGGLLESPIRVHGFNPLHHDLARCPR